MLAELCGIILLVSAPVLILFVGFMPAENEDNNYGTFGIGEFRTTRKVRKLI